MAWTPCGGVSSEMKGKITLHIEGLSKKLEQGTFQSIYKAVEMSWHKLESGDRATSRQWAQVALDYSWEQLNTGNWEDVSVVWREVYSTAALLKAMGLEGENEKALETLDRGILLGAPILDSALHSFAAYLNTSIQTQHSTSSATSTGSVAPHNTIGSGTTEQKRALTRGGKRKIFFRNYKPINSDHVEKDTFTSDELKRSRINVYDLASRTVNIPLINPEHRIPLIYLPPLDVFHQNYMVTHTPVVISGALDTWPAYSARKWRYIRYTQSVWVFV